MATPGPVRHLVVLAHPDPESFCASIAHCWLDQARSHGQTCEFLDLYGEGFDPVLRSDEQPGKPGFAPPADMIAQARRLKEIDVLVLVYPVWFGTPPAMMKGYLERVVGLDTIVAETGARAEPLAGVHLVDISTSASSGPWLAEQGISTSLTTIFDRYIAQVFGASHSDRLHLDLITTGMDRARGEFKLAQVRDFATGICAEANARRWA